MKWKTHIRIARAVADVLGIHGSEREALARGSIEPDKISDYEYRVGRRGRVYSTKVAHHKASTSVIMSNLYKARRHYLYGDRRQAMRYLGRALHYIQDRVTGKGFLGLFHERIERRTTEVGIDYYEIRRGAEECVPLPSVIEQIINSVAFRSNDPREIMKRACYISGFVASAVLAPPVNRELVEEYYRLERRHNRVFIPASMVASLVAMGAIYMVTLNAVIASLSLILMPILLSLDRSYSRVRKDIQWYSL